MAMVLLEVTATSAVHHGYGQLPFMLSFRNSFIACLCFGITLD